MEWGIPAAATGLSAWAAVKHRAIRERFRKRRMRREALDTFLADQMPALREFVSGTREREDKVQARETRITTELKGFREHLNRQDGMLYDIVAQLWAAARFDVQARFQCDHNGQNVAVNAAYAKLLRVSEFELGDWRWKNCLDESDAARYIEHVQRCFREHRRFEGQAIFRRGDGTRFRGHVRLEPHPEDAADLQDGRSPTWFGSVLLIEELS